jgi:hypothetical protein
VVFQVLLAVTVITWVADPVEYPSGNATPRCGAGFGGAGGGGFGADAGVLRGSGACDVLAAADDPTVGVGRLLVLGGALLLAGALVTGAADVDGVHAGATGR